MFKGEFKFDLQTALQQNTAFSMPQYSDAYHTTNEPIIDWLPLTPVKGKRILTVAASGDQPLMYAAYGAAYVDTFDITINACAVMDFKTTALQSLDYSNYAKMVQNLINLDDPDVIKNADLLRIISNMPARTCMLMYDLIMSRPEAFSQHPTPRIAFPKDPQTYAKMQKAVKRPFNFIWANLANLSHYIDGKYDIINVSNIFDHILWVNNQSADSVFVTIAQLMSHLNVGGHIICTTPLQTTPEILSPDHPIWPYLHADVSFPGASYKLFNPIIIQKTR